MVANFAKIRYVFIEFHPVPPFRVSAERFWQVQFGLDLCKEFAMPAGLLQGEGTALAAAGAVVLIFLLCRPQIGFDAVNGGVAVLLYQPHSHTVIMVQARVPRRWALS